MKIRSITYFCHPGWPVEEAVLRQAQAFAAAARPAYEAAGYTVQSVRLASIPFPHLAPGLESSALIEYAQALEKQARETGYEYVSLGPAQPNAIDSYSLIPDVLAETENIFFSGLMTAAGGEVSLPAVRACAEVIYRTTGVAPDGFTNLRFGALANVEPGGPFLPGAYHRGGSPAFALATEAADLAVEAFRSADSLDEARENLVAEVERHARALVETASSLTASLGVPFEGIDFTLAPFPQEDLSFGTALERLGAPAVGRHGSLAAAAILTDTLDRADFPRAGFTGLMLPVLEDAVLARRAAQGILTVKDLLMYAAVCGTGLDTVPLPGDVTKEQLAAVLLDVAVLAQRLDKPLIARLMPIPGKAAGDATEFDFAYFANSRVMGLEAEPLAGFLKGDETFRVQPRARR